jgi:hypothetical protein
MTTILRRLSIKTRVLVVSAILIAILAAMTLYTTAKLTANSRAVAETAELAGLSQLANQTRTAFGEYRYWLTDLAVSLLRLSELNANAAKGGFRSSSMNWGAAGPKSPRLSSRKLANSKATPREPLWSTPPTSA